MTSSCTFFGFIKKLRISRVQDHMKKQCNLICGRYHVRDAKFCLTWNKMRSGSVLLHYGIPWWTWYNLSWVSLETNLKLRIFEVSVCQGHVTWGLAVPQKLPRPRQIMICVKKMCSTEVLVIITCHSVTPARTLFLSWLKSRVLKLTFLKSKRWWKVV